MGKSRELVSFFENMFSRQEYLIPMVAASFQYPIHYYGMTSAALLEDLFVDASIHFRNNYCPEIDISRPERKSAGEGASSKGVKGWDYQFQGEHFSHKVGKGINAIALLWDATVTLPENKTWSYDSTMVYVLSNFQGAKANLVTKNGKKLQVTSIVNFRKSAITAGQTLFISKRMNQKEWKVLEIIELTASSNIVEAAPLNNIWGKLISHWGKFSANEFDIFISCSPVKPSQIVSVNETVEIDFKALPGVYIFEKQSLQNIQVTKNNRAVLLPATAVAKLAQESAAEGLFVFMPSWYMAYAENRPADLYIAQKQEFEQMNSAAHRR